MKTRMTRIAMAVLFAGLAGAAAADEPLLVLKGTDATLTFDARGWASSLKENATGRELLKEAQPMVTVIHADGKTALPDTATVRDGRIVYTFGTSGGAACMAQPTIRDRRGSPASAAICP